MHDYTDNLPLGKATVYAADYDPGLLCPIPRRLKRDELGLTGVLPFRGVDIWNAYELSWLTPRGKPVVAMGEFRIPCESPFLIESNRSSSISTPSTRPASTISKRCGR